MQRREKILLALLVTSLIAWQGRGALTTALAPLTERHQQIAQLRQKIERREDEHFAVLRSERQIARWQTQSLPPDPLDAQRLYQQWLTDLALLSGFSDPKITPGRRAAKGQTYTAVQVVIDAQATYPQLTKFLDHFHRVDLLHRVWRLTLDSQSDQGDPLLDVSLFAEGLALGTAKPRDRLFPQGVLASDVEPQSEVIAVDSADGFPPKAPFEMRIGGEFLTVIERSDQQWKVERGVEQTIAASHRAGAPVELFPVLSGRTARDGGGAATLNPFAKPSPPIEYRPRIEPVGDRSVVRGEELRFRVRAVGYDPQLGEPVYRFAEQPPPGSRIDARTGEFSWRPSDDLESGPYRVRVSASLPKQPQTVLSESFQVTLREPNEPPLLAPVQDQTAYYGQMLTFTAEALDVDGDELMFRLADGAPAGATIDAGTGEFRWTPADTLEAADYDVTITVSDAGDPPLSDSRQVRITLAEDAARFTYLIACINRDGRRQAWLYDRLNNRRTDVREAETLEVADVRALVRSIGSDFVLLEVAEATCRLDLGEDLRSVVTGGSRPAPAAESPQPETPATAPKPVAGTLSE